MAVIHIWIFEMHLDDESESGNVTSTFLERIFESVDLRLVPAIRKQLCHQLVPGWKRIGCRIRSKLCSWSRSDHPGNRQELFQLYSGRVCRLVSFLGPA